MKICMFTNTFLPHVGGVARSVAAFAEDLRKSGHEVLVVAPTFPGLDLAAEDPGQVVRVSAIQNFNGSDFSVRLLLPGQFSSQLDSFHPDIIHSHHPFLLGDAALRSARSRHLPLVFSHHTLYERYTHYVPFDSPAMQRFVIELATRFANRCQEVIAPSESIADLIRQRGVTSPCRVVPTGVDLVQFDQGQSRRFRDKHHIDCEAFVLGHLGRLAPEKNLDYLTEAAIKVCHKLNGVVFLVAGEGSSRTMIQRQFAAEGLTERLMMVGKLQGEEIADCYAAMDLFIFASTSETQGMVLTEAMAAGIPVIALDAPGAREVVSDHGNGRLLGQTSSTDDFAAAILEAASEQETLITWHERALQTASRFSRQACLLLLEEVYQEALSTQPEESRTTLEVWERLLQSLHAEWDLISSKLGAAAEIFSNPIGTTGDRK